MALYRHTNDEMWTNERTCIRFSTYITDYYLSVSSAALLLTIGGIYCGPGVLFETCVAMKFVDDDDDDVQ